MCAVARYSDYNDFAFFYNKYWGQQCRDLVMPILDKVLLPKLQKGAHILDVCCGTGQIAEALTERGYKVIGIDICSEMIRYAKQNARKADFFVADARCFQFPQEFDAAISTSDSLNHIMNTDELESVFRNVYAVLKPGGWFLFDLNCEKTYKIRSHEKASIIKPDHVCIVRGTYKPKRKVGKFCITTFRLLGEWERKDITLLQKCHSESKVKRALKRAGFTEIQAFDMQRELVAKLEVPSTVFFCRKPPALSDEEEIVSGQQPKDT
ncbi:MAG: methyltransferase domain-containing protein [Armatimonadota bacterium]|nr:methyltransferase domain-containing protein [Armatimonadota bacterium]